MPEAEGVGSGICDFAQLMSRATERITSFVESAPERRIRTRHSAAEIREHLGRYTFEHPSDAQVVLDDCVDMLERWSLDTTHPRHFGWFNPSTHPAGVVADTISSAYNPQLAVWASSPAGTEIELHLLRYLGAAFGYSPEEASGSFTSGGAEANLAALVLAATRALPDYPERGLAACTRPPACYVSAETHHTVEKALHVAGFGRRSMRTVPVRADGTMDAGALRGKIAADRAAGWEPLLLVANAGSTNMGALDPLEELGEVCARERLWFHVDAAWGGAAVLSSGLRHLLAGAEVADSIVLDPHKWLSMPMGTGMFLTRHHALMQTAFRVDAPYAAIRPERDFYTSSMQWSRRFTGLRLFMALAIDGRAATAARLDHQVALADLLRRKLRDAGWSIDNDSPFPVVCFHDDGHRESAAAIAACVNSRGRAWLTDTKVPSGGSASALRACVTSYRTGSADIEVLVDELGYARRSLCGADSGEGQAREGDRA